MVRVLVTFNWLERAAGARGRRRRAARALCELAQPKKSKGACAFLGSPLQPKRAPSTHRGGLSIRRAVFAHWDAGMRLFNGAYKRSFGFGCGVSCSMPGWVVVQRRPTYVITRQLGRWAQLFLLRVSDRRLPALHRRLLLPCPAPSEARQTRQARRRDSADASAAFGSDAPEFPPCAP